MIHFNDTPVLSEKETQKLAQAKEKYITQALASSAVPLERVRYLYRKLQKDIIFPRMEFELSGAIGVTILPKDERGKHYASVYGALVNQMAGSYGIARALDELVCDARIGVQGCLVEGCLIDQDTPTMHLWNVVSAQGRSYHLDLAMEIISNPQTMRYSGEAGKPLSELDHDELPRIETLIPATKYCLVSDDVMRADHIWSDDGTPRCLSSYTPLRKL